MAYPFAPAPRFSEFKRKLADHGCEYKSRTVSVEDDKGKLGTIYYFERKVGSETKVAVAEYGDDEFLTFSVVRSICARLDIHPKIFGLDLG